VPDIVACIERIIGIKAKYRVVNKGIFYSIPCLKGQVSIVDAGIVVNEQYMEEILHKFLKYRKF
jgi:hypothetical protein